MKARPYQALPRHSGVWTLLLALGSAALSSCASEDPTRYPYAGDCMGSACRPLTGAGGGGGSTPGATSDAGLATEMRDTLVVRVTQPDATKVVVDPSTRVEVALPDVSGETHETRGAAGVALAWNELPTWLRTEVQQDAANPSALFHSTLRWVGATEKPIQLLVAEKAAYEDLANALVVEPTSLRGDAGHVLFQVVQPSGLPVAGASFSVSSGVLAYDLGETFSDSVQETGDRGLALWFNAPVSASPGARLNVSISGKTRAIQVPVMADGLTLVSVGLE